jgi:hypothetical protein
LSYDDKCFADKNGKWSGSDLLQIAFQIIDKIKDMYNIKTITLMDNSQKFCKEGKNIDLGLMLTLLTGDTWYGKYGFRPKEKLLADHYEKNKKIMKNKKLADIPYFKNYDTSCEKFYEFYSKLASKLGIIPMRGISFIKYI